MNVTTGILDARGFSGVLHARRRILDEVLPLLADKPEGIRASDVYRARIVRNADQAHALLAEMETAGELNGLDEKPGTGGHVTRIFTRAKKSKIA